MYIEHITNIIITLDNKVIFNISDTEFETIAQKYLSFMKTLFIERFWNSIKYI